MILDNSSRRFKDSESFRKVILSLDMSKEDWEDCKKWVIRIRGQPGAFHAFAYRRAVE